MLITAPTTNVIVKVIYDNICFCLKQLFTHCKSSKDFPTFLEQFAELFYPFVIIYSDITFGAVVDIENNEFNDNGY